MRVFNKTVVGVLITEMKSWWFFQACKSLKVSHMYRSQRTVQEKLIPDFSIELGLHWIFRLKIILQLCLKKQKNLNTLGIILLVYSSLFFSLFHSMEKLSALNEILWNFQKASSSLGANPDEWFKHKTILIPAFELLIITKFAAHAATAVAHSASPDVCYPSFCMQIKLLYLRKTSSSCISMAFNIHDQSHIWCKLCGKQ